jgi:hypothetical protein
MKREVCPGRRANNGVDRTDIEQEVNGLYSFDRREKIDAGRVKAIFDKAARTYYESLESA